jgi:hypothetical protein
MANHLNVRVNARHTRAIEDMVKAVRTTKAGVLKTALFLLQLAIHEIQEGNALGIVKGEKVLKEIVGLM